MDHLIACQIILAVYYSFRFVGKFTEFSRKKNSSPKKLICPKNSTIFHAQTQRTGSDSSQVNFKTHTVLEIFPVNESKLGVFAKSVPKKMLHLVLCKLFSDSKSSKLQCFGKKPKNFEKKLKLFGFKTQ